MIEVSEYVEKCECGRPWCEYFDPSGEYNDHGTSFTKEQLIDELKEIPNEIKRLKKLNGYLKKLLEE